MNIRGDGIIGYEVAGQARPMAYKGKKVFDTKTKG